MNTEEPKTEAGNANQTLITERDLVEAVMVFGWLKPLMDALVQKIENGCHVDTVAVNSKGLSINAEVLQLGLVPAWKILSIEMCSQMPEWTTNCSR